jgi:hypothetical protein
MRDLDAGMNAYMLPTWRALRNRCDLQISMRDHPFTQTTWRSVWTVSTWSV